MHENVHVLTIHWKRNPLIIINSPLLALTQDQVKKPSPLGFKAAFVDPKQDPKNYFAAHRERQLYICLPFSTVCKEMWQNTL